MQASQQITTRSRSGCLQRGARIALGLGVIVALLLIAGAVFEARARETARRDVSPPGNLVDVGGRRMHIVCLGQAAAGQPTVLLEAGAGGWSIHWYDFQRQVAQFARVCAYDRAGHGWSDPGQRPRDGQQIVEELHALLMESGEPGPYVMVGASRGGQYVRLYRDTYPDEVSGLVLVDAEPEDFRQRSALGKQAATQNLPIFTALGALSRVGVFRLLGGDPASAPEVPCMPFLVKTLPPAEHAAYLAVEGRPSCFDAYLGEEAATDQREAQVRQARPLGDLPLVVLTHGRAVTSPGIPPAGSAEIEQVWQELQAQLADLSSRGVLVRATESGHNIANDQPGLVLDAIRSMLGPR